MATTAATPYKVGGETAVHPGGEWMWSDEEIRDFECKLEFLVAERSIHGLVHLINHFLHLNQVHAVCVCVCVYNWGEPEQATHSRDLRMSV